LTGNYFFFYVDLLEECALRPSRLFVQLNFHLTLNSNIAQSTPSATLSNTNSLGCISTVDCFDQFPTPPPTAFLSLEESPRQAKRKRERRFDEAMPPLLGTSSLALGITLHLGLVTGTLPGPSDMVGTTECATWIVLPLDDSASPWPCSSKHPLFHIKQ
jgi:hypothetical protein